MINCSLKIKCWREKQYVRILKANFVIEWNLTLSLS